MNQRASEIPDDEGILDAATAWLLDRQEGLSIEREREFECWLAADPRHRRAIIEVSRSMELLESLPAERPYVEEAFGSPLLSDAGASKRRGRLHLWIYGGVAATLAVIGLGVAISNYPKAPDVLATGPVQARGAEQRVLTDGSSVHLNSGALVDVKFDPDARRVILLNGEAQFEVAPDPTRPFEVVVNDIEVRAIGTIFNVRATSSSVEVMVLEGRVGVSHTHGGHTIEAPVGAGEQAIVAKRSELEESIVIRPASSEDVRQALTWRNPMSVFSDVALGDLARLFGARSGVRIVVSDSRIAEKRVGGMFALDQLDVFLRLVERDPEIVVEQRTHEEIHLRARSQMPAASR